MSLPLPFTLTSPPIT